MPALARCCLTRCVAALLFLETVIGMLIRFPETLGLVNVSGNTFQQIIAEPTMPVIDTAELAPIRRLIEIARSDTGQSRRVANFLLAWWNAGDCGGFDLTDLWMLDKKIADDMLATVAFVARHHEYPNSYGFRTDFETLVALWRPQLL
jgi:hypothetical protein